MRYISLVLIFLIASCNSEVPSLKRISPFSSFLVQLGSITRAPKAAHIPPFTSDYAKRDLCLAFTTDSENNMYCGGYTNGSIGEPNASGISAVADFLIIKFSPKGKILWATQLGQYTTDSQGTATTTDDGSNTGNDRCFSIDVDEDGNVYCGGDTNGIMDTRGARTGTDKDGVIVKLDKNGKLVWVTQIGTTGNEFCRVKVSANGNIICAGNTTGAFVSGENPTLSTDAFVAQFSSGGNLVGWGIKQLGSNTALELGLSLDTSGSESCDKVLVDNQNNIFCSGTTSSSLIYPNPGWDAFIWKISSSGVSLWLQHYPSSGDEFIGGIVSNSKNEIYIGGHTNGSFAEASDGSYDIFLLKADYNGNPVKKVQIGALTKLPGNDTSMDDYCDSVNLDQKENVYCSGITLGSFAESNVGNFYDIITVKLSPQLELLEAFQLGRDTTAPGGNNDGHERLSGISVDKWGNILGGGHTQGSMGEANGGNGQYDIIIFKLDTNRKFN